MNRRWLPLLMPCLVGLLACGLLTEGIAPLAEEPTPATLPTGVPPADTGDKGAEVGLAADSPEPTETAGATPEVGTGLGLEPGSLQQRASLENAAVTGVFPIELIGTSAYINSLDRFVFIGAFRNAGEETYGSYTVTISLLDDAGNVLAEQRGFPHYSELEPDEFTAFSVFFEDGTAYEGFTSFEVQADASDPNPFVNRSRDLTLTDVAGGPGDFVDYEITGMVTNNSSETLNLVQISAALFDANNNLVGAESGFSDLDEVGPGVTSPFDILIFSPLGEVDRFELNVQGSVVE